MSSSRRGTQPLDFDGMADLLRYAKDAAEEAYPARVEVLWHRHTRKLVEQAKIARYLEVDERSRCWVTKSGERFLAAWENRRR